MCGACAEALRARLALTSISRSRDAASPLRSSEPTSWSTDVDVVCYGVGPFSHSRSAQLQLACVLALRASLGFCGLLSAYDPLMKESERRAAHALGVEALRVNEEAKRRVSRPTVFFMFHCGSQLYDRLVWANCGADVADDGAPSPQRSASEAEAEELKVERPQLAGQADPSLLPCPLRHVLLVGNSIPSVLDRYAVIAPSKAPASARTARPRQSSGRALPSACPLHSAPVPPPPLQPTASVPALPLPTALSPEPARAACRTRGKCDCLCLVDALGVVRVDGFNTALSKSDDDVQSAMSNTALHSFSCLQNATVEQKNRVWRWLRSDVPEPPAFTFDGELVLTQHSDASAAFDA